jgi:hypothetical protein
MRILILVILAVGAVSVAGPVQAQTYDPSYPVCMQVTEWGGGRIDCSYTSMAQCTASASGRAATCLTNPYFAHAYKDPPGRVYRQHRRIY